MNNYDCSRQRAVLKLYKYDNDNDDDEDDDDDDEPPDVDVSAFAPPPSIASSSSSSVLSYGWNKGRSSPTTRKAIGRSASSVARIHLCTNCGSEFVKWMGRCPTCKEWNTLQEYAVTRQAPTDPSSSASLSSRGGLRPLFGRSRTSASSWLDGIASTATTTNNGADDPFAANRPVRVTDLYGANHTSSSNNAFRQPRIVIPNDDELNMVLGGGLMKGSLLLVGGEPGVGKSTLLLQTAAAIASLATPTRGIGMGRSQPAPNAAETKEDTSVVVGGPVWYVSGEENPEQIASRAARLGIFEPELWLLSETHADALCEQVAVTAHQYQLALSRWQQQQQNEQQQQRQQTAVEKDDTDDDDYDNHSINIHTQARPPSLVIIDSIQTMVCDAGGSSAAGGITQVRECVALFLRLAKSTGIPVVLVGHVTKTGDVAGPRTVEHMVDCVLYLEGSSSGSSISGSGSTVRMLRASKNRFGSSDEVGVYEMTSGRLLPVSDPSSLFLAHRTNLYEDAEGSAIAIALEGRRAMAVEVQALVTPSNSNSGFGRRTVDGIANSRLLLLLGVLQKRCGLPLLARQDVYINVVGRMRLDRGEGNAADLAVAVALVSSLLSIAVRSDTAFVGEIGLLGELRNIGSLEKRLQEARRMGFSRVVTPRDPTKNYQKGGGRRGTSSWGLGSSGGKSGSRGVGPKQTTTTIHGMEWIQCDTLMDAINTGLVQPMPKRKRRRTAEGANEIRAPGSLEELGLDEIMDVEDNDDDDAFM